MSIAAIIVNYNAGEALGRAVSSLDASTVPVRVHVVDNASADDSVASLRALPLKSAPRVWQNTRNLGFAAACNRPLDEEQAELLLFLNPDCEVAPTALEELVRVLKEHPQAGMVGPLLLNADGTEQRGGRRRLPTPGRSLARVFGMVGGGGAGKGFDLHQAALPDESIPIEAISGACMLVRRAALDEVGPLDEGYFMHCEDLDWCMRFWRAGWEVWFAPAARVVHEKGACSRARPVFVEWHKHRGMLRFYRKFYRTQYPRPLGWLVGAAVWVRFGVMSTVLAARAGLRRRHG